MKILYDHQIFSLQRSGGISRYFNTLIKVLPDTDQSIKITTPTSWSENHFLKRRHLPQFIPWRARQLFYYGMNYLIDLLRRDSKIDIYHPTYFGLSRKSGSAKKTVVTIFDMIHELGYMNISLFDRTITAKRKMMRKADAIIAISQATKQDICSVYPELASKISVIYLASDLSAPSRITSTSSDSSSYILYVGNRGGYKNFWPYLDAVKSLLLETHTSLIAFGGGAFSAVEQNLLSRMGLEELVTQASGDDELLAFHYKNALFLAYPSRIEGFGLPIVEAFSLGCPVLTSNTSSMKEISGDAALLIDPTKQQSMKLGTEQLISSQNKREKLAVKGFMEARKYSWEKCAVQTLEVYKSLLSKKDIQPVSDN